MTEKQKQNKKQKTQTHFPNHVLQFELSTATLQGPVVQAGRHKAREGGAGQQWQSLGVIPFT